MPSKKCNRKSLVNAIVEELEFMGVCIIFKDKDTSKKIILPPDMCKLTFIADNGIEVPIIV
jgi:hypothetical protein